MTVTVLAVGNPIMGDDGIGPAVLERLGERYGPIAGCDLVDGGISGLALLPVVQDADRLLILDALAAPRTPGTVVRVDGDQLPRLLGAKLSPHQVGMLDVLAAARLLGQEPRSVAAVGIVPAEVDLRVGLSPGVAAAISGAADAAAEVIREWLAQDQQVAAGSA